MKTDNLTEQQKDQLLAFFAYYLPMEMREQLMAELPRAYNAWGGREVVRVVRSQYGDTVAPPLNKCEIVRGQQAFHSYSE